MRNDKKNQTIIRLVIAFLAGIIICGVCLNPSWKAAGAPRRLVTKQLQSPQRLWSLPAGASFEALSERPHDRLGIYWSPDPDLPGYSYVQYSILDKNEKSVQSGEVPGHYFAGNGIAKEDWNIRGQHAFLPQCDGTDTNFLRLKNPQGYRVLRTLPRFNYTTLLSLRFSPDGKSLYVLGIKKLWIIDAQSGRLLRIITPRGNTKWSNENAVLSPDCQEILGMKGKVTLYSTRNGATIRRFGIHLKTFYGSCGDLEVKMYYSKNGRYVIASGQGPDSYETWIYPAHGGALCWHGSTPYEINETADGQFFLDTAFIGDTMNYTTFLRSWHNGKIIRRLKLTFPYSNEELGPNLIFSRDGRWIYYVRDNSVWRIAMPKMPNANS